jgi:hypothetical protein
VAGPFATFAAAASRASPKRVIVSSEVSVRLEKGVEKQ